MSMDSGRPPPAAGAQRSAADLGTFHDGLGAARGRPLSIDIGAALDVRLRRGGSGRKLGLSVTRPPALTG